MRVAEVGASCLRDVRGVEMCACCGGGCVLCDKCPRCEEVCVLWRWVRVVDVGACCGAVCGLWRGVRIAEGCAPVRAFVRMSAGMRPWESCIVCRSYIHAFTQDV